jgi:sucrose-6-phosphate hydrolase SacC (GH32 family)
MTSPEFAIESDYLQVTCAGTFHPTRLAVVLIVDGKDVRSCSPERGYGFLGYQLKKQQIQLLRPPDPAEYAFDVRPLRGKTARIELRDQHRDGCFFEVRVTATDRKPAAGTKVIATVAKWAPDHFETPIDGDFLLLPVGPLVGTPLQPITVEVDGRELLAVDLPLAFGSIEVAGYLPIYDLTGHQGKRLKVSFHSYEGKQPGRDSAPFLLQREIPGREVSDQKPAFHVHNRIGLLNDPNGLVYHNGEYHLCHQFNYNVSHLDWAHYVSRDLVHWEERPIAILHDWMGSMHSGSGAVDVLNTSGWQTGDTPPLILAYTASFGNAGNDKIQTQCIAYSTDGGRTFTKFEGNPVLGKSQVLARGSGNARDPKVFWFSPTKGRDPHAEDGHWVMVLFEGSGLNIYTSDNLRDWDRHGSIPGFHECPELFPLAVDGDPKNVLWIMYGGSGHYHIGTFDGKTFEPQTQEKIPMYHDGRCYAAQTFNNTPPGTGGQPRRIQVAWQGGRRGLLSTPTELTLRTTPLGLRVCKQPVEEIAKLRTRTVTLDGTRLAPGAANPLSDLKGGLYDLELEADLSQADRLVLDIRGVKLTVEASADGLKLGRMTIPGTRELSLRLIVDNTSLDVYFGDHGVYYSPKMIKPTSKSVSIEAIGDPVPFTTLRVYELKGIW